jgi:hypothetical protein
MAAPKKVEHKVAVIVAVVAASATIVVAAINLVPSLFPPVEKPSKSAPAASASDNSTSQQQTGNGQQQTGDGQQQGSGIQQRTGDGSPITNVFNGQQQPQESTYDRFRNTTKLLGAAVSELKQHHANRVNATSRKEHSRGVLAGIERFLAIAVAVQTRFDEGEANKGRAEFQNQLGSVRTEKERSIATETTALSETDNQVSAARKSVESLCTEAKALLAEAINTDSTETKEANEMMSALSSGIASLEAHYDRLAIEKAAFNYNSGFIAGATEHHQRFFDIMFSMDREEAQWSRNGGEERAPAGGYTRLVNEELSTYRTTKDNAEAKIVAVNKDISSTSDGITESIASLRGLSRALFPEKAK